MNCSKYNSICKYIPECLETLVIKTGKTGSYKVVLLDKFKRKYEFTGTTTGDITLSLEFGELHYSLLNRFAGQFGMLIYISDNLLVVNCEESYNSLVIQSISVTPSVSTFTIDLTECNNLSEFDNSFDFSFAI